MPNGLNADAREMRVDPADIDVLDERYRVSLSAASPELIESIRTLGVITPPLLERTPAGFRIVCGFKRIQACMQLSLNQVSARVLAYGRVPEIDLLRIAIADNALKGGLNLMEAAAATGKLMARLEDEKDLPDTAAAAGIRITPDLARKYLRLQSLPETIQRMVYHDMTSMKVAFELGTLNQQDGDTLANLIETLRPTTSQQLEMLTHLKALSALQQSSVSNVLLRLPATPILEDERLDRKAKIHHLRREIRKARYPHLARFETAFHINREKLDLPPGLSLIPSPGFENPAYTFALEFETCGELAQKADYLGVLSNHPALREIMKREIEDT